MQWELLETCLGRAGPRGVSGVAGDVMSRGIDSDPANESVHAIPDRSDLEKHPASA